MANKILTGLSSLLLPFGLYGAPVQLSSGYSRSYLSATAQGNPLPVTTAAYSKVLRGLAPEKANDLDIIGAYLVKELVVIDSAVPDKQLFYRGLKPGIDIVEIDSSQSGVRQLKTILAKYHDLTAIHIVSHAQEGALLLGNSHITAENIKKEVEVFAALNGAVREGGDLLFYGCELAANAAGEELLDIVQHNTHLDVAASNNLTGDSRQHGDWNLEIQRGHIETELAFTDKALADFNDVLAPTVYRPADMSYLYNVAEMVSPDNKIRFTSPDGTVTNFNNTGTDGAMNALNGIGDYFGARLQIAANPSITSTFELHSIKLCVQSYQVVEDTVNLTIIGYNSADSNIGSTNISVTTVPCYNTNDTDTFDLSATFGSNYDLKRFVISYTGGAPNDKYFVFKSVTLDDIKGLDITPPSVSSITLSGSPAANASSVTYVVAFDEAANNISADDFQLTTTGTANGTISSVSASSGSPVNVTVNGISGAGTLRLDLKSSTNIVDAAGNGNNNNGYVAAYSSGAVHTVNMSPTVTDGNISISGASGTGGTYKIGDTISATWNNTAGGDNNASITGVIADFSQFGGGAAVAATNSASSWTATYTVTAGAIDATNRNVSITASNADGSTTTADTTNATVDNVAPTVSDANISISGGTGAGGTYIIGDTVTVSWNNTAGGENNTDIISIATVDFSAFGGGAAVAASNSSGTWTATYTLISGAIDATNRNVSVTATDNAGNATTTTDTTNAIVDSAAPTLTDGNISISGATGTGGAYIVGDTVTATWNNTAGGDNNSDIISAVTVDFSQFGGGVAVAATNSSGTWTATYTLVAGAINSSNRNVSVTVTDNAGNTRTQADSSNAVVDNVLPAVASVGVPANATYIVGQNLDFTVNTTEAITVNTGGGTPQLTLTIGSATVYASYLSGSGSNALTFRYTVHSGDLDTDGIAVAGLIETNGGILKDSLGNTLNSALNSVGNTTAVLVDAIAPTVSSVTVPANDTYVVGETLSFTVSSTENVTVNTGGGTPRIAVTIGGTTRYATYISGSGTTNLVFSYTVQVGDNDTDGIALASSIDANGGALLDGAGNDLVLTLHSVGSTIAILVDTAAPTVQSLNPVDGDVGVAVGANFVLTMNEDIQLGTGIIVIYDADDLAVATIDVTAHAGQLSTDGDMLTINPTANLVENTSYYIQIANGAITDLAGNIYAGISNKTDWNFTVADVTPPVVTGVVVSGLPAANAASLVFSVSLDEVASNFSIDDFALTATGSASGSIASVSAASGTSVDVTVNTVSGTGSLRLDVNANTNIQDTAGNGNGTNGYTATYTGGASHAVDRDPPLAPSGLDLAAGSDSGISSTDNVTNDTTPTFTGSAEANSTVTLTSSIDDALGNTTADGAGNWSFTTPLLTSNSAHNITATATDVAGNTGAASTALALTLDTQTPTITSSAPTGGASAADVSVIFNLAFSESVNSLTTDDFALVSTGTASGSISNISASSGAGVAVTVNAISGTGSLKVGHVSSDITDDAGNALGAYSAGAAHSVDTDAPTIASVSFDQASVTQANQGMISLTLASAEVGTSANYTITGSTGTPVTGSIAVASASQQITNIDVSGLGDGTLTVSLTLTDAAGNISSPAVTDTISKDAVIPTVNVVNVNDGHYGVGSAIDITLTLTEDVVVSGTLSTLSLDIDGVARQAVFVSAASGVLTYRYTVQAGDNTGASGLIVDANGIVLNGDTMRDTGSNDADLSYSQWDSVNVIVDTTAPVDPIVTAPAGTISTNLATTLISGTHPDDGVTISLYADVDNDGVADNATVLDDTIVVAGTWTLSASLSTDSGNNFVVIASDAASNVSAPQNVPTITQDSTAPAVPSTPDLDAASDSGTSSADNITKNTTLVLTGTAEAGASVVLSSQLDGELGTVNADGSGDWSVSATNVSAGTHSITAVATDIAGNSSVASSALSVTIDTSAPTSSVIDNQNIQPGESSSTLAFTIADDVTAVTDILVTPASSETTVVPLADVVLAGSNADRSVTVTALGSGTSTITLTLEDGAGNTSTQTFEVVVNSAPTILGIPATNVAQGAPYSFVPTGADADGNSLLFDITNRPAWASFNTATGELSGTPTNADVGVTTAIVISVNDGVLSASLPAFNLTVTNVNDAPTISSTAITAATQDTAYSYSFAASDTDVGDTLTLSAVTKPSWLSFNAGTGLLSGTPSNADVGAHPVTLRVTDTDGLTAEQSFSITVTNVNDAPTISSTALTSATQDAAYSYTLVATDSDVGDSVTLSAVTLPSWLSFNAATGVLSGTPTNANVGSHAVVLRATDVDGLTIDQSFTIVVANVNDAPTISSTALTSATQDAAYSYTLVATDSDVGDSVTLSAVTLPSWLSFNAATGVLSGNPTNANVGSHAVVLRATDVDGLTAEQSFSIVVANVNDAPTISSTALTSATQDAAYSYTLVATDSDVGDTLTLSAVTKPSWLSFNAGTGLLSGTPSNADVGAHPVTLRVTDTDGLTAEQSFSITVTNVNDAPTISSTALTSATQDAAYSYTLVATDSDVGDSVTLSAETLPSWLNFNPATGVLSGTPTNANVGSHAVVLRATDVDGLTAEQNFSIVVANVNDAPTISSTALTSATQDAAYSYTLVATDSDVGDSVTLSAVTLPSWLSFNAASGVLSGTPTNANVGSHAVLLRATDVDGLTIDQSFTIVVANVNDAPTISSTALTSATQDAAYSYTLVATDSDVGDSVTLSAETLPSWLSFNAATGVLSGTPTNANVGSHEVVLRATDVDGLTIDQSFTIVVANVNDAPTISSMALTSATQDAAYSYTLVATDSDVGDSVTLSAETLPSWLSFNAATGVLSGTPTNANVGSHAVVLRATDVDGLTAEQNFSIVVANVNDAPTISSTALTSATQDAAYSYTLVATDSDVGDSVTLSAETLPSWLSFNPATGVLSGTPTNANVGSHAVVLRATDVDGLTIDQSFTIVVANVNDAPTISSTALTSATQDAAYSYTLVATDSDVGDSVTLSAETLPSWLNFNPATGVLSGTPTNANVGSHAVVLRATDVDGLTAEQNFSIVVANVNDAPTISSTALTSATQDAAYSYTLVATDSDVGDSVTLSAVTLPSWLSFNAATGVLSGTPTNANVGSHEVVLRATDVDGLTIDQSFTIVVANVNDAPTISSMALTSATQDAAYSYTVVATDSDVGDSVTLSAVTLPSWLSFNAATGVLSGTPTNANVGSHEVVLRATDVDGLTIDQSFTIVVANVNDAPTISSTALTSATQDAAYSYTLVATDSDVGDSVTLSAVTLPSWLSFNAATGVLSGTPTNANVGSHAVVLRATDVDGLTAEQSFSIVVANVNDAPVASNQSVTLEEDSSVMITFAGEDADNDPLTYEISAQPASGTLEQHGSVWLYTPEKDFNGTDSIGFIAKDAELSSEPATVTVTVTPVNDDPQAVDDSYTLTSTANDTYSLAVLANDVDVDGDTLSIDGAAADIGSVQITADGLNFTAPEAYVGPVALRYTISDGNKGRATAKVNVLIEGADSANQPVITLPDDVEVNATGLFTRVKLGFAKAVDRNGHPLPVSLVNKSLFFAPGNYLAYWQAVDSEGNKAIKAQKVKVNPLISLSKDQVVAEGNQVTVSVHLNGEAPSYPLSIPYTVSGTADSSDHDLVDGVVEIASGQMAEIHFTTLNDGVSEGNEEVLISLDPSLNLGSKQQTQVVITEANIAPQVSLAVTQAGQQQVIVAQNGGDVHIRATASDANEQDTLTLTWASGALSLQADATGMMFSPAAVTPGIYPVSLTVTDDGSPMLSSTETVYIVVRPSLAALTSADTDGDLIPDVQEGYIDSDSDGIPDYLDANNDCNVMPEGELQPVYFLAEGQAGVCLRLGNIALSRGQSGVQLQPEAVAEDALAANVGGIFDFIATGLPQQGQSYSLVLPQRSPVPANAVYRKFNAQAGWRDFVIDANNTVASTEGERGFCPPPGDSRWMPGLTEGHWCVQLTIEDGGPNDDDGVANRTIVDPSGVAVMLNGNHLPVANPDSAAIAWNQSIDVNVLANDTDSDGDSLSVTQVISEFGTVTVLADQRLSYTPATDFIGTDVLVYSITDGKGGTASSELTIVVNGNTAPVTVDDSAATDDRTSLLIDVLSNDTDVDGNTLTLLSATAQQGTVAIEANKLRYIPKTGFDGVDTVTYRISDGQGGEATGQVLITVKAYQEVIIDNKSGGGSMTLWALAFILACAILRRRELQRLALGCLLLLSVTQQAQATDWYVEGFIGQAQADKTLPELNTQVGEGQLLNVDDSDTAFGVSLGYQWTPIVALELGYADFGEGTARIKGATLTPEQYHELVKTVTPVLADGVMLGLRFTLLQHQGWRFEVPVGLFHWQADIGSTMGNTTITTDLDGTDWYAGVRFSYQFSDAWSVGLGYQYLAIEPNDLLSYQLNLRYQF